jgi:uncharacterized protein
MRDVQAREQVLELLEELLPSLHEKYGVVRLALYGSFAHGSPSAKSDIDLLVDLSRPLGLEFVSLAEDIEKHLGRKVDLTTFETLNRSLNHPRYRPIALNIQRILIDVRLTA